LRCRASTMSERTEPSLELVKRADKLALELEAALSKLGIDPVDSDKVTQLISQVTQPHRCPPRLPKAKKGPRHRAPPKMKPRKDDHLKPWVPAAGKNHLAVRYRWLSTERRIGWVPSRESGAAERFMVRLERFNRQRESKYPPAQAPVPDQSRPWIPTNSKFWGVPHKGYPETGIPQSVSCNRYADSGSSWSPRPPPIRPNTSGAPSPRSFREAPAYRAAPAQPQSARRPAPPPPRPIGQPASPRTAPSSPAAKVSPRSDVQPSAPAFDQS